MSTRKSHSDNLCHFRALVFHLHGEDRLKQQTSVCYLPPNCRTSKKLMQTYYKVCEYMIFQPLKTLTKPTFSRRTSKLRMEFLLETLLEEALRSNITLRMLHYNRCLCYVSKLNGLFQAYRCLSVISSVIELGSLRDN